MSYYFNSDVFENDWSEYSNIRIITGESDYGNKKQG